MHKLIAIILLATSMSVGAQQTHDLNKSIVKDGKPYTYKEGMPYTDRGEVKNRQPEHKREQTPVEKGAKTVMDAPIRPTIINGGAGVQYQKSTP